MAFPLPPAMRRALDLAREAADAVEVPVGAVVTDGKDRIVAEARNAMRVTLHDPCNLVRWGGVSEPQRRILARVATDFVEMTPNRIDNFCWGGGGGLLSLEEYGDGRVKSGSVKADQVRATGAKVVAHHTKCSGNVRQK